MYFVLCLLSPRNARGQVWGSGQVNRVIMGYCINGQNFVEEKKILTYKTVKNTDVISDNYNMASILLLLNRHMEENTLK